jgi:hypothetical protein
MHPPFRAAKIRDKYRLQLPPYLGTAQCVRIGGSARCAAAGAASVADMRLTYGTEGQSLDEADVSDGEEQMLPSCLSHQSLAGCCCLPVGSPRCPTTLRSLLLRRHRFKRPPPPPPLRPLPRPILPHTDGDRGPVGAV